MKFKIRHYKTKNKIEKSLRLVVNKVVVNEVVVGLHECKMTTILILQKVIKLNSTKQDVRISFFIALSTNSTFNISHKCTLLHKILKCEFNN